MIVENVTKAVKCTIPKGFEETVVPAHGYTLLWADKQPEEGPLHLNFKLGVTASENITLTVPYRDSVILLSSIAYESHATDDSYGRVSDGHSDFTIFEKCVDTEGKEYLTSTPLNPNGSIICETVSEESPLAESGIQLYVHNGTIVLEHVEKGSQVEVYSTIGTLVAKRTAESERVVIPVAHAGVYIVRVGEKCWKVVE